MVNLIERPVETGLPAGYSQYEVASLSDAGKLQAENEDALGTFQFTISQSRGKCPLGLFVVADGMGGEQAGRRAANIAVSTVVRTIAELLPIIVKKMNDGIYLKTILEDSFRQAHRNILSAPGYQKGMGTTLVASLIVNRTAYFASVGDSRGYVINGRKLRQITSDHSLAWILASCGQITKEDICSHPRRAVLLRTLGSAEKLEVDTFCELLGPGDEILLCSNGLWEMVCDEDIENILCADISPAMKVYRLIDKANANGGRDNITVVVARAT